MPPDCAFDAPASPSSLPNHRESHHYESTRLFVIGHEGGGRWGITSMVADEVAEQVTWGELGCPKAIGAYQLHGASVRVKNIHIIVAEDDPRAIFTVVTLHPPLGPPEFMLGHRIA